MDMFENPAFVISIVIGGIILAGISSAYQLYSEENEGKVKPKAVLRDGLLGSIFVALAWTFIPDSMQGLASKFASTTEAVTNVVEKTAQAITSEIDIQIGPARF
jgi:preprotein translocase subunit Sec61beta